MNKPMRCLMSCALLVMFSAGAHGSQFKLHVSGATPGGRLPQRFAYNRHGCNGANLRPDLKWSGAPAATRSFAVSVFDPDAGSNGFWHWIAINLSPQTHTLPGPQALPPPAHALRNDYGHRGWGGPCPPPGPAHHYVFTVYALNVTSLALPASANPARAIRVIEQHVLKKSHVTLTYGR